MELIANPKPEQMIQDVFTITHNSSSNFIEANTQVVSLEHLKKDCIIPVFSKDNESTISHFQFINETRQIAKELFPELTINQPNIRVSHIVKGRVPSAIGKPAKELKEHEKTIYYERCAFLIDIPEAKQVVNNNELNLSIGGVRAYNQENLYSKKSLEKFKIFIGFKNRVCTNLCISTDGFSNEIRIASISELHNKIRELFANYDRDKHLGTMENMSKYQLTEKQFAHFIGKVRMFQHLDRLEQKTLFPITLNDSQISNVVKDYYGCSNFGRQKGGTINLWNLYNLFTEANKSSYIDSNLERNVNAYELVQELGISLQNSTPNWYLP
ncbi:DUF3871 family protein [Psychroserpens sp. XS_ASV72]|uniref:DUF3871 family protein n=1 Tax=Psychroserpens sp. XS_ASV72 TaxID=3241293 RepID=UPI003512DF9C